MLEVKVKGASGKLLKNSVVFKNLNTITSSKIKVIINSVNKKIMIKIFKTKQCLKYQVRFFL